MNKLRFATVALAVLAAASSVTAQNQYIGYVYPAGGQQGTAFPIRLGGQGLIHASDLVVSGEGVSVRLVEYYRIMSNEEQTLLRNQLKELQKKGSTLEDPLVAQMALFESSRVHRPGCRASRGPSLVCPACGAANAPDAFFCVKCKAKLEKPKDPKPGEKEAKSEPPTSAMELARQKMIERIQSRFADDERNPAVRSQTELVFAEVTVAPDATPGRREIRVITKRGVSNPLPFYVGQVPEVARKPMKTCPLPVLGKEYLAQRKRPPEEEELRVMLPCTMNGQIAPGEVNRYRFRATKGQRLVISAKARDLVPYVADGVPGWFQAVLRLHDANGKELAYNDDFRCDPDPLIYFEVPEDGEYLLTINEALFRGRESFVYRITIGELPLVTSIFPLGGRVGEPVKIEMDGWNLEKATLSLPPHRRETGATSACRHRRETRLQLRAVRPGHAARVPGAGTERRPRPRAEGGASHHHQRAGGPPGDWDVFEVEGKAGETIVAEVNAAPPRLAAGFLREGHHRGWPDHRARTTIISTRRRG